MYRRLIRKAIIALIVLSNILFLYLWHRRNSSEYSFFVDNYLSIGDGHVAHVDSICHLPIDVSPFDPSIERYLERHPSVVHCSEAHNFQPLTYIDENSGVLLQNLSTYTCHYQVIKKHPHDDNLVLYESKKLLDARQGFQLTDNENYVKVECCCHQNKNYENVHFWFNPKLRTDHAVNNVSVLILVVESLSRLNYLRYLNQTRHVLEKELGNMFYLEGLNKMADNSFPNMVPLLTGKRLYFGELHNEDYGPYDDWPFIWKDFNKKGYVTTLIEDYPKFTLFNYESKGFVNSSPTDFYPRPFWIELFQDVTPILLKYFPFRISSCFRDRIAKVDIFLDQVYHFMKRSVQNMLRFFAFTFYIELTHNDFNKAQTIDSHLAKFFRRSMSMLNDTVVIFMGDHGNRFGSVLHTTIGRIEERMPLLGIHVPQMILNKHPHLSHYLKLNQRRLCTWLDINQLLNDVLNENLSTHNTSSGKSTTYSPWREEIPLNRTCQDALIPDLYCACDSRVQLNHDDDKIAKSAAKALVDHVNTILSTNKLCHHLSLKQILSAELIFPSGSTVQASDFQQKIEVTILVDPSEALFRSRLYRTAHQQQWTVDGSQVTRINEYGNQSSCITKRHLKPFCFC